MDESVLSHAGLKYNNENICKKKDEMKKEGSKDITGQTNGRRRSIGIITLTDMQRVIVTTEPVDDGLFLWDILRENQGWLSVFGHGFGDRCWSDGFTERLAIRFRAYVKARWLGPEMIR